MVPLSGQRLCLALLFVAIFSAAAARPAAAQSSIDFNGGFSIDPEQVYAGVAWRSPDFGGRFHLRPGIDGGFGDDLRLATVNIDLIVKFPIGTKWELIQGGGPTIAIVKYAGDDYSGSELHAGGSYLFGFAHESGFFAEFRVGGGNFVPQLKLGVGYSVELK